MTIGGLMGVFIVIMIIFEIVTPIDGAIFG